MTQDIEAGAAFYVDAGQLTGLRRSLQWFCCRYGIPELVAERVQSFPA